MHTTLISTADLAARLDDRGLVVVDVRHDLAQPDAWGESQYRSGHVPGALFAHLDRDLSAPKTGANGRHPLPSPEAAAAMFGRLGIGAGTQVVAYDQGSRRVRVAAVVDAALARARRGGGARRRLRQVAREGRPVTADVPRAEPTVFPIRRVALHRRRCRAAREPAGALARRRRRAGARALSRRRRAARSRRRPHSRVAQPSGLAEPRPPSSRSSRRRRCAPSSSGCSAARPPNRVVHSCGSGVTACHNVLAMEIAGIRRHEALSRLVERVVRRSVAAGRPRQPVIPG